MAGAATTPQAADAVQLPVDDFDAGSATAIAPQSADTARALARDSEAAVSSCWLAEPSDSCKTDIGIPAHNCMMSFATPCNGSAIKSKQKSAVRIPLTMFSLYGPAHAPSKLRFSCSPLDFLTDEKVKGHDPPAQGQGEDPFPNKRKRRSGNSGDGWELHAQVDETQFENDTHQSLAGLGPGGLNEKVSE